MRANHDDKCCEDIGIYDRNGETWLMYRCKQDPALGKYYGEAPNGTKHTDVKTAIEWSMMKGSTPEANERLTNMVACIRNWRSANKAAKAKPAKAPIAVKRADAIPSHGCVCGAYAIGCKDIPGHSSWCGFKKDQPKLSPTWFKV